MKIFKPLPAQLIMRVNIKRQGDKTEHINLIETNHAEVISFVRDLIEEQNLSPFQTGKVTNVEVRESLSDKNLKSNSVSFKGLSPSQVKELIINSLTNKK